jgi:Flp pilus assembly pilin Flp
MALDVKQGFLGASLRPARKEFCMKKPSLWKLLKQVHQNEEGAVSLETILIVGAIALPILIFLIRVGWPRIKEYFNRGLDDLEAERQQAVS